MDYKWVNGINASLFFLPIHYNMNQNSFNPSHSHPYPTSASSLSTLHRPHTPQHLHCNYHCDLMPFTTTRHPAPSPLPNNHCGHRYCLTPSITSYPRLLPSLPYATTRHPSPSSLTNFPLPPGSLNVASPTLHHHCHHFRLFTAHESLGEVKGAK